eukprot:CAMPEP_0113526872 /NCGR_PEP_ID=MMETSP0015_2-20120614/983_1 /TAXON_ID=2838 /ORGANISM="Odontella" /LENGTH=235 /DNA_ID=CAMNT_0000425247 /DNA_START=92 /DNA_END=799 /DNA_ORIENTATION=- /assembly_acc=CAM_ASM_000160
MSRLLRKLLNVGAVTLLYNGGVHHYAEHRMSKMAEIPSLSQECSANDECSAAELTTAELRRSVSLLTGLVENLDDRRSWNRWLPSPPTKTNDALKTPPPGEYTFMYRSYVNFEEAGAMKKALLHIPTWWGFVQTKRGKIIVNPDGNSVTNTENFLLRLRTPVSITWNGRIVKKLGKPHTIEWTSTSMTMGDTVIPSPPASEKLRKIPWEILKVEDGIMGFRRGDIGMLAYATSKN